MWIKKKSYSVRMLITIALFSLFCCGLVFTSPKSNSKEDETVKRVAILQVIEHPALNSTRQGIEDELKNEGENIKIEYECAQGNPTLAAQIAQKFVGNKVDLMVGIGTTTAQALVSANKNQAIPIVFSSVTDPLNAKLVSDLKRPNGKVTGVSNFVSSLLQFKIFKEILPKAKTIGIIYNPGDANAAVLAEEMKKNSTPFGFQLIFAAANSTAEVPSATLGLIKKVDAIFINNDNTALAAFDSIIKIATLNKVPVFCSDTDTIKQGALAALGPNQYQIGRQTGKLIRQILNGTSPGEISVEFPEKTELYLNQKIAKEISVEFPQELIQQANHK